MAVSTAPRHHAVTRRRRPAATSRRDPASAWRHVDLVLVGATFAIATLGVLMVWSATRSSLLDAGHDPATYLHRQALFVGLGAVVLGAVTLVDYRHLRDLAGPLYAGALGLLVAVLTPLGTEVNEAQAWFAVGAFQVQPAELAKLALVVALAASCATGAGSLDGRGLVAALALAGAPMALILLQPDLGTMLVFVAVAMGVLLVAGTRPRHLALLATLGALGVVAVLQLGLVEDYQRDRLRAFLDPSEDVQRSAYSLNQAQTAIGNGGLTGTGLLQGSQTNLDYVPEQSTDFIFTVVGEELGFVGAATLLALYGVVVWRAWRAATLAPDPFGTLLCTGVLMVLVFQVFQNVGMTMGLVPITGIPLPFVSYGGSSTLTMFAAVGLVLNVHMRRFG